jgi:radical SAM superfamily enzyme YgiQ (UPF0313 family)
LDERDFNLSLRQKERELVTLPAGGEVRAVIAYPNRYWLAMSNLGFQTVYRLFREERRLNVERAYLPEDDKAPCRTFESNALLSDAEILALSVSFETDYPFVLKLLAAAGLDLASCRQCAPNRGRESRRPFIIGGGAALTLNPEPLANFFDAIVIGEGEGAVGEITAEYLRARDHGEEFLEMLRRISSLEGVYVPRFYEPQFNADATVAGYTAETGVVARVKRRFLKDLDRSPTHTVIQSPETEFKSMFMTETGRGCECGCKFCVAGYMYRPTRKRSAETLSQTVKLGMESSDSIGFVGAAVSSHPRIAELTQQVAQAGKRASLSSSMSQKVTRQLAASLSESEYKTVALAPEAGTEELRFRVGKRVKDEQFIEAVTQLAQHGIKNFKLYFIVGLPTEEERDVEAIAALCARTQAAALEAARQQAEFTVTPKLYLSVNPFIPKAWTPFQRHGFLEFGEIKRRLAVVRSGIRRLPNVEMKHESPRESYFQALVSRGDRRVGDILLELHDRGLDWRWLVKNGARPVADGVPPADFWVYRTFGAEEVLPWESVDLLIKRSLLEREYRSTFERDPAGMIAVKERKLLRTANQSE